MQTDNNNQESSTLPVNSTAADASTPKMKEEASTPKIVLPPLDLSLVNAIPIGQETVFATQVEIEYYDDSSSEVSPMGRSPIAESAAQEEIVTKSFVDAAVAVSPTLSGESPEEKNKEVVRQVNNQGFFAKEVTHDEATETAKEEKAATERTPLILPPIVLPPPKEEVSEKEGHHCCRCSIS